MSGAPVAPATWFDRFSSSGAILCYHAVSTRDKPSSGVANVELATLHDTVTQLQRFCEIVPLSHLLTRLADGRASRRMVALTFDDAYESLTGPLAQMLKNARAPISVFVTNTAAQQAARFWWDRVDDTFPLVSSDRWQVFEREIGLPAEYVQGQPAEFGPLRPVRQWILAAHKGRWPESLEPQLAALERDAGSTTVQRAMSYTEIDALRRECEVEVGVHTLTHPVLPLLTPAERNAEISGSHEELRARFADVLPVLAIPFGLYDAATLTAARSCGMSAALTLAHTSIPGSGGFALPRLSITRAYRPHHIVAAALGVVDAMKGRSSAMAFPELPSPRS